ncbi:hypothetical protein PPL_01509 [Heterostelium album PN500]|uniref:Uncharacterized protein n=1 Tax=Heterostelium pallidum (strain ATCC 26659 / Pp 5 / PN500) TaxID=670386 RepID=D3AZG8_HETP5|nr:hypothetical protein PPL_01509 [Heterostelium album PN500]EFA85551.1 hypothetical protein PPL_01509 [Heterostelium album PN500]|eukprot:XP_020437659.1 hypothetical protein PPL_01509 [Heterostelium album PN500]
MSFVSLCSFHHIFYRTSEEMSKNKKLDLSDENINDIIRNAENHKEWNVEAADQQTTEDSKQKNILKANKKIRKMVPEDVEKFD